jgi:AAA+ superfamily predicted ATPase
MRLGLLALEGDALVPSAALRLRVAGLDLWPDDLHDVVWLSEGQALRPVLPDATAQHLDKLCRQWGEHGPAPLTYLIGPAGTGRTMCARQLAAARASRVLCVDTSRWPDDRDILTLAREARWRGAALLLRFASDTLGVRWRGYVRALLAEDVDVLISLPAGGPPESFDARAVAWLTLGPSQQAERRLLWARHLPQARRVPSLTDEALAFRFRGSPASIARLARQALDRAETDQARVGFVHISEAAQAMMSGKLSQLATLERPLAQGLGAVVLPAQAMAQLRELLGRVSHREQVLERWGFGDRLRSGLGTVAMFSGPPGTGKTLSARAVAGELGVSLYRIDLSQVFSKWIGETEKHLGALFDEAEASGAALLFDEADALFAKRTEVRSSNDRYANLESAFLLQRIEAFTGLCFLTTNMDRSIDDAFMRRMAVHLRFAMPAQAEREAIWRGSLPEVAPLASDVSLSALAARFEISGGAIRNAALRAAYRAAQAEAEITQADLIASAEQESASSGALTRSSGR